jgi:DNA phosphorothioation system restriction enzyme
MGFKQLHLKYAYDSNADDLLWNFYIPTLSKCMNYDRISGFFSSTSLSISARGLASFIAHKGHMRLITCPRLSKSDVEAIEGAVSSLEDVILKNFITDYECIETQFQKSHVSALGWMIANGYLDIKIAVLKKNGHMCSEDEINEHAMVHQKVGIMYDDEGNSISFSGSNNESATGWIENIEEFKVFRSWSEEGNYYLQTDIKKFDGFWNEETRKDCEIYSLPEAIKKQLFKISEDFYIEDLAVKKYFEKSSFKKDQREELRLFFYQKEAVDMWINNDKKLLLQMATGCGKTRTAIGCIQKVLEEKKPIVIIISCPQPTLSFQWKDDIEKLKVEYDKSIVLDGSISKWDEKLRKEINMMLVLGKKSLIVYTTHKLCAKERFTNVINEFDDVTMFLIGDEVHGMGAKEARKGLLSTYKYRLGLSATPDRWFDSFGSKIINTYFGGQSFVFSILDAQSSDNPYTLKPYLVNYTYHPEFVQLTDNEMDEYIKLTNKITRMSRSTNEEMADSVEFLMFQRANIEKNAKEKYELLIKILDRLGDDCEDTIIFVSDEQIGRVMKILGNRGIRAHKFTESEGRNPSNEYGGLSERQDIINRFKKKQFQVLVAIKCLDEGIDIPSAKRAIVMASSTNPREYVQRIGRIIRQDYGKFEADIYDMIIHPDLMRITDETIREMEKRIFKKEMDRVLDLSSNAKNNSEIVSAVFKKLREVES